MAHGIEAAVEKLRTVFADQLVTPDVEAKFQQAVAVPWSQTCWTPAAGYVYVKDSQELTQAVDIVKSTGSKFAVRTTGHNPNAGFSSADRDTIVLDIRQFQSKELTSDGVARVGSGSTWGEVYAWLEEHNLSAIGGRDRQVGLGGFLLGGGMGALPNLYGLGADGVKNFEILLADGSLVNANADENADLHRALKGGGSNFGIVTRFDLETHPLINVQYTINAYNLDDYVAINKATVAVQKAMEDDPKIGLFTNYNNGLVAVGMLYGDTPAEPPGAFQQFRELNSLLMTVLPVTNGTVLSLAEAMGHVQETKKRAICTSTTQVSQELYDEVYKYWVEVRDTLPADHVLHYTIQPMGSAGVQEGKKRGGNIMGHQSTPQTWWVFTCEWPEDGDDTAAQGAVDKMLAKVQSLAEERQLLLDYQCMSFAQASQKVLGSYGAENIQTLQDVAAKYDPEGVFQKLQHGGFLLRNNV
ncbi:FAD-binding oxidoreductase [Aspergillus affinis]|uniref:FAD-binding oxidoreductase n=1 Tax=Aspergillus affinis TaxID=1070780 RepID=UPI0022FDF840|nr:6-hydroxy-D-nicotine oxidase [Aspergillus affinis]KAI9035718.1 6-hydroxy-D-nicotine oxidase [Aspergillus affinis]